MEVEQQAEAIARNRENHLNILAAITRKLGVIPRCSLCGQMKWQLDNHFVNLSVSDSPFKIMFGGEVLPCVAMICDNCGNTHLLNLKRIGLDIKVDADAKK